MFDRIRNGRIKRRIATGLSLIMVLAMCFPASALEVEDAVAWQVCEDPGDAWASKACEETMSDDLQASKACGEAVSDGLPAAKASEEATEEGLAVSDTPAHVYAAKIRMGECRYLKVGDDTDMSGYSWKVSDEKILSVNQDGRCKGLSCNIINGFSEALVTAQKGGVKQEMWIKVLPAMCIDNSTMGVPGARWNIAGIFKEAAGKVRYRSTKRKILVVDRKGVAKGKKAGEAVVIKEVNTGGSWTEVDRETFTICQPWINTEMVTSRLGNPTLSGDDIVVFSEVMPSGFKSSRPKVITVEGDLLKLNKQGTAVIYTLFGTVGKPLKYYQTRIEVIGKTKK